MRKLKRYLAMFMAAVIAVTSVNIPAVAVYAQDTGDAAQVAEATPSDADGVVDISEGVTRVNITSGAMKKFRFTPAESATLNIYSTSDDDTIVYLYDADGHYLHMNDNDGYGNNFKLVYSFTAGKTYILEAGFYYGSVKGSFDIVVEKVKQPEEINISEPYTRFLAGAYYPFYDYFCFKSKETDGSSEEFTITGNETFDSNGFEYSVWIKDEDGNYAYADDGVMQRYRYAQSLEAGKYTVEIMDANDDAGVEPVAGTKIWASYDIYVQSPDEYFADKQTVSETEIRTLNAYYEIPEYYKFTPSETGDYIFSGIEEGCSKIMVYASDYSEVSVNDSEKKTYSLTKGQTYYIGLSVDEYYDNEDDIYNLQVLAQIYSAPVSAEFVMSRTDFPIQFETNVMDYMKVSVTLENGRVEMLDRRSYYDLEDRYGKQYKLYIASEGSDWNSQEYEGVLPSSAGTYTLSVAASEDGETWNKVGSQEIQIVSIADMDFPKLSAGTNKIHSAYNSETYSNNIYKLDMPYDGRVSMSPVADASIYRIADGGAIQVQSNAVLKKGTTYYVMFCKELTDDDGKDIYDWTVDLSIKPCISSIEIEKVPAYTKFIYSIDRGFAKDARIKVTYSNGETESNVLGYGDVNTRYGEKIYVSYNVGETSYPAYELPIGQAYVKVYTDSGITSGYDIEVCKISDVAKGTLHTGVNAIDTEKKAHAIYEFTPDVTGVYDFGTDVRLEIYHEDTSDGEYKLIHDAIGESRKFLDKGITYYVDTASGTYDKWGNNVYSWTMNVQLSKAGEYKLPVSWKLDENGIYSRYIYMSGAVYGRVLREQTESGCYITYDGGTEKYTNLHTNDAVDSWNNTVKTSLFRYDDDTSEYVECDLSDGAYNTYLSKGKYKTVLELVSRYGNVYADVAPIEIPFEVWDVTDAYDGEWDISKPLYLNQAQTTYMYKASVPEGVRCLSFKANALLANLEVYDADGKRLNPKPSYANPYTYSDIVELDADVIYLYFVPGGDAEITKVTASAIPEVVSIDTEVDKDEYLCEYDHVDSSDVTTTITYADGAKKVVHGTTDSLSLCLLDAEGQVYGDFNRLLNDEGEYTVVAKTLNMSDSCQVKGTKISVKKINAFIVQELKFGEQFTDANKLDKKCTRVYKFTPEKDQDVIFNSTIKADVYTLDGDGHLSYFCEKGYVKSVEKGEPYYIVTEPDAGESVTVQVNTKDTVHIQEKFGLDESKELTLSGKDYAELTFTPEETGEYKIQSYGSDDTYAELYKNDECIASDDDSGDDENFALISKLEKGVKYTFKVKLYSENSPVSTFSVLLSKVKYEAITGIKLYSDDFRAIYADDGSMIVSGQFTVEYGDDSYEIKDYSSTSRGYYDKYDNTIQSAYSIEETDGDRQAVVEFRYLNKNSTVWNYIPAIRIDVEEIHIEVKELVEGETFDTASSEDDMFSFVFKPAITGNYIVDIDSKHSTGEVSVTDEDGNSVKAESSSYRLRAGVTYKIDVATGADYKITIRRPSSIADVEITGYKGQIYKEFEDIFGDNSVELKVTYADGTTETVSGANKLSNGRRIEYSIGLLESSEIFVEADVAGITDTYKITYSNKDDIESLKFTDNASYKKLPENTSGNARYYIYKMVVPADGIYDTDCAYDEAFMMPADGGSWENAADVLKNKLKKGDVYYLKVLADLDGGAFYVAPADMLEWQVVKEPTCTATGSKRRYDPELGKYVTAKIPATGHSFGRGWTLVKKATSKADGYKAHICTKCGGESTSKIVIKRISSVKLSQAAYTYDNKVHKPGVVVKDSGGKVIPATKYTVTYPNTKSIGKVIVKITFKGEYSGTSSRSFKIVPKASAITRTQNTASGIKITWSKSTNAGGYLIQRKKGNGRYVTIKTIKSNKTLSYIDTATNKQGVRYAYRVQAYKTVSGVTCSAAASAGKAQYYVKPVGVSSAANKSVKKLTVTWKKNTAVTGYQIQYSGNNAFKNAKIVTIPSSKVTSKTIANLQKKKYYVRMRGYKKVKGVTYYSSWSSAKSVTVSK